MRHRDRSIDFGSVVSSATSYNVSSSEQFTPDHPYQSLEWPSSGTRYSTLSNHLISWRKRVAELKFKGLRYAAGEKFNNPMLGLASSSSLRLSGLPSTSLSTRSMHSQFKYHG